MNPINFMGMNQCKHGAFVAQQQCFLCEVEQTIKTLEKRIELLENKNKGGGDAG